MCTTHTILPAHLFLVLSVLNLMVCQRYLIRLILRPKWHRWTVFAASNHINYKFNSSRQKVTLRVNNICWNKTFSRISHSWIISDKYWHSCQRLLCSTVPLARPFFSCRVHSFFSSALSLPRGCVAFPSRFLPFQCRFKGSIYPQFLVADSKSRVKSFKW